MAVHSYRVSARPASPTLTVERYPLSGLRRLITFEAEREQEMALGELLWRHRFDELRDCRQNLHDALHRAFWAVDNLNKISNSLHLAPIVQSVKSLGQ